MCICVYVYMFMYLYVFTSVHVKIYTHTHIYIYINLLYIDIWYIYIYICHMIYPADPQLPMNNSMICPNVSSINLPMTSETSSGRGSAFVTPKRDAYIMGFTIITLLHEKTNPENWQVLSLGDAGFIIKVIIKGPPSQEKTHPFPYESWVSHFVCIFIPTWGHDQFWRIFFKVPPNQPKFLWPFFGWWSVTSSKVANCPPNKGWKGHGLNHLEVDMSCSKML